MPPKSGEKRAREEWSYDFGSDDELFRRTLRFVFSLAVERVLPGKRIKGGHSIGNGHWYKFEGEDGPTSAADCEKVQKEMKAIISKGAKISVELVPFKDALDYFLSNNQPISAKLLSKRVPIGGKAALRVCTLDDKTHYRHNFFNLMGSTADLTREFSLTGYEAGGLVLCQGTVLFDQPAMCQGLSELITWGHRAGVTSTADLVDVVEGEAMQGTFIHAAETRIENKISEACERIVEMNNKKRVRVVAIAGPTASGKTTFSHKLALSLRAHGLLATPLTVDHYYLPLDQQPKFKLRKMRSDVDYDSIESMDLELVQSHIMALSQGETVTTPVYNMKTGYREKQGKEMSLGEGGLLIIEGIHALNPNYTAKLASDEKFRIFISPMTALQIDDFNVFKTTDHRLGRRMCRDYLFRGNDAARTLRMWENVRQGEHRWIFPHQNGADFVFNSAMECELPLLKGRLDMLLRSVPPDNADYEKATHLLNVLDTLPTWQETGVASTSILREFIGGSLFNVH